MLFQKRGLNIYVNFRGQGPLRGLLLRGRRGRGRDEGKGRGSEGKREARGEWEGEEPPYTPLVANSWLRHCGWL